MLVAPAPSCLSGHFRAPLPQLHRGLDCLDALGPRSNGHIERSLEALIGFDQPRVLIRRGNRRRLYQLAPLVVTVTAHTSATIPNAGGRENPVRAPACTLWRRDDASEPQRRN